MRNRLIIGAAAVLVIAALSITALHGRSILRSDIKRAHQQHRLLVAATRDADQSIKDGYEAIGVTPASSGSLQRQCMDAAVYGLVSANPDQWRYGRVDRRGKPLDASGDMGLRLRDLAAIHRWSSVTITPDMEQRIRKGKGEQPIRLTLQRLRTMSGGELLFASRRGMLSVKVWSHIAGTGDLDRLERAVANNIKPVAALGPYIDKLVLRKVDGKSCDDPAAYATYSKAYERHWGQTPVA
jgi:hypothetical protein